MDIVKRISGLFKKDKEYWNNIYLEAEQDLDFQNDKKYSQWEQEEADNRFSSGRPVLTIDQLSQFIHLVSNQIRMNTPAIGVIPAGSDASVETAEIIKGLIRHIEYKSQADNAYDLGSEMAIRCSIGYIEIDHDYEDDESFNQELKIKRVINPLQVFLDSNSMEIDGRDAMHVSKIESMPVREFKELYPDKPAISFDEADNKKKELRDQDYINLCRFYEIEETEQEIALQEDGTVMPYTDDMQFVKNRRKIKKRQIKTYLINGAELLEEGTFPGKYIPFVPVYGEELWINGNRNLFSLIRKAKDAQRMFNYWKSLETELLQKQPQAPIMAVAGTIEDFSADWTTPSKAMALRYKQTDAQGNPAPPPQRLEPPVIPTGILNASRGSVDDIKATMGLYNPSLGLASNETSGIAIQRRQEEGGVATYHFVDNFHKSLAHVGRVILCAIPEVYDGARMLQIVDEEENMKSVGVNGMIAEGQDMHHMVTDGKYDVRIIPGAAYTTRRQEAAEFFNEILMKRPDLLNVIGDLAFKYQDFTGAQAIAARMEKLIDPKLLDKENEVDPEKEQMQMALQQSEQVIGQLQQQLQTLDKQVQDKQAELILKAKSDENKTAVELQKIEIQKMEIAIEEQKLKLEEMKTIAEIRAKSIEIVTPETIITNPIHTNAY